MIPDILRFVNSRDIRAHLQKINYQFTAPEVAYLVYFSYTATLEEKLAAWQKIIDTMPDCSMEKRLNLPYIPSIHEFLRRCIRAVRSDIDDFFCGENCVYTYSWHTTPSYSGDDGWTKESRLFTNFETCIADHELSGYDAEADLIRIRRHTICKDTHSSSRNHVISLFWNKAHEILLPPLDWCGVAGESVTSQFHNMWFNFPTPFRCGDIVRAIDPWEMPMARVLYYLNTWNKSELLSRGFPSSDLWLQHADKVVEKVSKMGDYSDMQAYGCGYDIDGQLEIGDFGFAHYLDLEYVTEPLTGNERLLHSLSSFLKGNINAEVFVNVSNFVRTEAEYIRQKNCVRGYGDEILKAVGLESLIEENREFENMDG